MGENHILLFFCSVLKLINLRWVKFDLQLICQNCYYNFMGFFYFVFFFFSIITILGYFVWESMAARRKFHAFFLKFGTMIEDSFCYQIWTYICNNNFETQHHGNMIPISSDSLGYFKFNEVMMIPLC